MKAMLYSFTWEQYLLAAGAILGLYYLAVLLLYYRDDIFHILKGKTNRTGLPADPPLPPQVSILGPASPGAGPLLSEAATIRVAPQPAVFQEEESGDAMVDPILQEITPLLELANESDAEKDELLPLLCLVTSRHNSSIQDPHRRAVERFLTGQRQLPFTLTPQDLQSLWKEAPSEQ